MRRTSGVLIAAMLLGTAGVAHAMKAINFNVVLSGAEEVPSITTMTTGQALLHVNKDRTELRIKLDIRDATAIFGVAGAHLHCAPAGENGPVVAFLAGDAPPGFDGDVQIRASLSDASIINTACGVTMAELVDSMLDGSVYINVHSIANPGGEIRGQIE